MAKERQQLGVRREVQHEEGTIESRPLGVWASVGCWGMVLATGGGDHLFSPEDVRLAERTGRAGPIGWRVVGTNGFLNNVWVCRVRGDSRHCGNMSVEQHLCWVAAPTLADSTEVDNNHIFVLLKIMNAGTFFEQLR